MGSGTRWVAGLFLGTGCTGNHDDVSPFDMPHYGDCTRTDNYLEVDEAGEVVAGEEPFGQIVQAYDAEERLVAYYVYYWEDLYYSWEREYDGEGCLLTEQIEDFSSGLGERYENECERGQPVSGSHGQGHLDEGFIEAGSTFEATHLYEGEQVVMSTFNWVDVDEPEDDWVEHASFSWELGKLVREEWWWQMVFDHAHTWEYDAAGDLAMYTFEDYGDAPVYYLYEYDEHGRTVVEVETPEVGGAVNRRIESTWSDAAHVLTGRTIDREGDGVLDSVETYDCTHEWPYACVVVVDGSNQAADPPDGIPEDHIEFVWSCPVAEP